MNRFSVRNSNIEILRIVGMLFIILQHALSVGLSFDSMPEISGSLIFMQTFIGCTGWLGNMLFIMISGYFLYDSKFSLKKILMLWFQLFLYSAGISLIVYFFKIQIYGVTGTGFCFTRLVDRRCMKFSELIFSFMPFCTAQNWYATKYIVFLFFVPFLNVMIRQLDRKMHARLILLMFVIVNVFSIVPFFDVYLINDYSAFFMLFFAGSYMKKYDDFLSGVSAAKFILAGILVPVLYMALRFFLLCSYGTIDSVSFGAASLVFSSHFYSLILTWSAVSLFAGALRLPEKHFPAVNLTASSTFGVYLLHNHNYFRRNVWMDFFNLNELFCGDFFIPSVIVAVLAVFAVCSIIDILRKIFLEPLYDRLIDSFLNKLHQSFRKS